MQPQPARAARPRRRGGDAAGGVALAFNTIAVSDNQSQGTPGMRASLISREVIADSIELMVARPRLRRARVPRRLRQDRPRRADGARRVDKPAVVLYSGPMRAGRWRGAEATIQDVWEAVGADERGLIPRGARRARARRVPWPGTCAGQFTANTMAIALDCLGHRPHRRRADPGRRRPRPRRRRRLAPARSPSRSRDAGHRRAPFLDRRALLNAMAGIAATRRLDQRPAAPARDRPRGRRRARARRPDRRGGAHAGDRQPRARRALHRRGAPPGRRHARR